jgi:alpha-amylase
MSKICVHFQVIHPHLLRTYRFFDINRYHNYFDDYQNNYLINRIANRSYIPANRMLLDLINKHKDQLFFSFSISGSTIRLFQDYCPDVLESFQKLVNTGNVEITGSTFTHSLASLHNKTSFLEQVKLQEHLLEEVFQIKPTTFCNTEIIYSDEIGEWLHEAGYKVVLTEGARHLLGWKSPSYLYCNPYETELKLLLRNYQLCDDVTLRFNDQSWDQYPLTAEKFIQFMEGIPSDAPLINLFWDYETMGILQLEETGIFEFYSAFFDQVALSDHFQFVKPCQISDLNLNSSTLHAPWAISCSGDEKDINEWLGNELQQEAFEQLFKLEDLYVNSNDTTAKLAWLRLQNAFHFNFMSTKWFPKQAVKKIFDIYSSPYQAFINYMNALNDVKIQLENSQTENNDPELNIKLKK